MVRHLWGEAMPTASHTQWIFVAALVALSGLSGCKKPEAPAQDAAPVASTPPEATPAAATPPAQAQATAAATEIGNCYTAATCTPAHNPAPGEGGMTQDQCKTTNPTGSWEKMSTGPLGGIVYGPCVTPP